MEFSHLILIEISFYSSIMYSSTDDGDILNFTKQLHEHSLEQKTKSTFSICFSVIWGIFFPPKHHCRIFLNKTERKKIEKDKTFFGCVSLLQPSLNVCTWGRAHPFLMATLADNCNYKNIDVCMRSWAMHRKQILNAKECKETKSHSKRQPADQAVKGKTAWGLYTKPTFTSLA